jgi:hypothetical protein
MPTASTTSPKARKAGARKPATRRTTSRRSSTQAKASRAKASRTRAVNQSEAAAKQAQTATRDTAQLFGDYAERAVLIPVGAALIARDRVVSTVSDTLSAYSSPARTQQQLRRFERRGVTARNRLEREVRKARVRFERELRQRRRRIETTVNKRRRAFESTVSDIEGRTDSLARNGSDLANRVQERVLNLV